MRNVILETVAASGGKHLNQPKERMCLHVHDEEKAKERQELLRRQC